MASKDQLLALLIATPPVQLIYANPRRQHLGDHHGKCDIKERIGIEVVRNIYCTLQVCHVKPRFGKIICKVVGRSDPFNPRAAGGFGKVCEMRANNVLKSP